MSSGALPHCTDDDLGGIAMFHGDLYVGRVYKTERRKPWAARTARQFVEHDPPACTDHRTRVAVIGALVDALASGECLVRRIASAER